MDPSEPPPPLLDHDPARPWEAELAQVCRLLVVEGHADCDRAALEAVSRLPSSGKPLDSIRGSREAWVRQSTRDGRRLLETGTLGRTGPAAEPAPPAGRWVIRDGPLAGEAVSGVVKP